MFLFLFSTSFWIKAAQLILSLSILVMVHEFGHYFFARLFKVRVEKFYLFFNPNFSLVRLKKINGKWQIKRICHIPYRSCSGDGCTIVLPQSDRIGATPPRLCKKGKSHSNKQRYNRYVQSLLEHQNTSVLRWGAMSGGNPMLVVIIWLHPLIAATSI